MAKREIPVAAYRRITKRGAIQRVRHHFRSTPHHMRN